MARKSEAAARGRRGPLEQRRRWSVSEGQQAIRAWERSGQSMAAFCEARGIHPERLRRWHRRLAARGDSEARGEALQTAGLVEAVITGASHGSVAVVVQVGSAARIEVSDPARVDTDWVLALATGLARRS